MKHRFISLALTTAALLLGSHLAVAADTPVPAPQAAASKAKVSTKTTKSTVAAKPKAIAKVTLVDINTASAAELKKLPNITEADAAKIIAGRPYGSKAWLVSHKIIDAGVYEGLKQQVIAKQPNKDATKNAALYGKKK
jgi:DNA uptake protein ComE-like DNA-binding protein